MVQQIMYPAQPDSPDFTLAADITTTGQTAIVFLDLTGLLAAPNTLTIRQDDSDTTPETMYYAVGPVGTTLTVTRGYGGTVAKTFTAGALACRAHTALDHNTIRANILDLVSSLSGYAVDTAVFHKATAGEINALTLKAVPVAADVLMIEDSAGSAFTKAKIAISTLPFQSVLTNPVIGLTSSFVSGDVITGTGTGIQVQDSGVLLSALATKTQIPSAVSGDVITGTGTGIQDSGVLLTNLVLTNDTRLSVATASTIGLCPILANTGTKFLRDDGTWQVAGSGTVYSIASGNGMNFTTITGSGTVTMGTPGSITSTSTNAVSTTSHTHAIDTTIFTASNGKSVTTPLIDGTATIGATNTWADGGHIHPTDTSRAAANALGTWAAFSPSPVWGTANPTITTTVARYVQTGKVVTFNVSFVISNGNAASSLTMSLPVAAPQTANYQLPLIAFKKITTGGSSIMSDPFAYIDYTLATPTIKFNQFGTLPSGYTAVLNISGSYEVSA